MSFLSYFPFFVGIDIGLNSSNLHLKGICFGIALVYSNKADVYKELQLYITFVEASTFWILLNYVSASAIALYYASISNSWEDILIFIYLNNLNKYREVYIIGSILSIGNLELSYLIWNLGSFSIIGNLVSIFLVIFLIFLINFFILGKYNLFKRYLSIFVIDRMLLNTLYWILVI